MKNFDPSPAFTTRLGTALPELAAKQLGDGWTEEKFTRRYSALLNGLRTVCHSAANINLFILEYQTSALQGRAVHFGGAFPTVRESIDQPLADSFELVLNGSVDVLVQEFLPLVRSIFDIDIACLIEPILDAACLAGLPASLGFYLLNCHSTWIADLVLLRAAWNRGWRLAPVEYFMEGGVFHIRLPLVNKVQLNLFCRQLANRLCFLCEDTLFFLITQKTAVRLIETPLSQRDPAKPYRFCLADGRTDGTHWVPQICDAFEFL